jgi:hypothetical protein
VLFDRYFFEIPIYRCSREAHHAAIERKRDRFATLPLASAPSDRLRDIFNERYFTEWAYNEVVGWIRVFWLGPQLRAEYHLAKGARHLLAQHRRFECCEKLFETDIPDDASNAEIVAEFRRELAGAMRVKHLKGFVVDLTAFDNLAPHVDWRSLMLAHGDSC